jgi:transketolase
VAAARERCRRYRRRILDISQTVQALHAAPAFSCTEITDAVYSGLMRRAADGTPIDRFLMSKGHGCMVQYVILNELGILSDEDLAAYCKPAGRLGAHPDYGLPGIQASTGSLGHGMGIATGLAYGDRTLGHDRTTYVVLSDGEFQEGSTWEAMMMAGNLGLSNLVALLDLNDYSGLERMSEAHRAFYPVDGKAEAFGWAAVSCDGHDGADIFAAAQQRADDRPTLLICNTVKGKGVSYMENVPIWHYRSPSPEEYQQALEELAAEAAADGAA